MGPDTQGVAYRRSRSNEQHWHLIYKSRLFVIFPGIILGIVGMNFVWEVARANVDQKVTKDWPLRFTITDLPTTATIAAALGALMLARAQFARTVRPYFGYSWTQTSQTGYWDLHFHNSGPGYARIISVEYRYAFVLNNAPSAPEWTEYNALQDALRAHDIASDEAYVMRLGQAPLPPQPAATDGFKIASFTLRTLALIERFEVKITADDSLGDHHQLILRAGARLPREATEKIEEIRGHI